MAKTKKDAELNQWYQTVWLPFAAATYIIICIFDFMIMPIYVAAHNAKIESHVFAAAEGKDVTTFATTLAQTSQSIRQWNPLTLEGAGLFHLAFGALLTGGAVTRGMAKKTEIEGYYKYGAAGYEDYGYDDNRDDYQSGPNQPYRPNRPGYYNANRNPREAEPPGPMKRTDE